MKNIVKIMAVLTVINTIGLVTMTPSRALRQPGTNLGAHARWLKSSDREYNELYRNRNRTPEQQKRFEELTQQRKEQREILREGGVKNLNRAL